MVTIRVSLVEHRDASYDILIGRGQLAGLPALLAERCPAAAYAVVSDSHVGPLYGEHLARALAEAGHRAELFTFPAGEWNKTRETWADLSDRLLAHRFGRDAAVMAVGGGVVGDVGGFVAATYLRGVPCVQVPTTLLAMIDSSIGGKTGVDVPAGKNLLGAFHQPRLVVADLDTLGTLSPAQLAAGIAEAVKHGVIADAEYFEFLERDRAAVQAREPAAIDRLVSRSVEIKSSVVAADERETGRRAILNFGHTVGHAIEAVAKFAMSHGEAVAMGMCAEARLAETLGIAPAGTASRIDRLLAAYALPRDVAESAAADDLLAAMRQDKKAKQSGHEIRFALPRRIGEMAGAEPEWTVAVPEAAIRDALAGTA